MTAAGWLWSAWLVASAGLHLDARLCWGHSVLNRRAIDAPCASLPTRRPFNPLCRREPLGIAATTCFPAGHSLPPT